ncbi:MAG: helix-turn-helix domain-containing protein [SAR324 cluster bacterium]|nr:helix-turn-helix domain-containing protein [SAR324 cluster bacterium]
MIKIQFSPDEINELAYQRFHHPHPRVQRKMQVVWFKSQELPHKEIARLSGVTVNTVTNYLSEYQEGGIEKLKTINFRTPESELKQHQATLEEYFQQHPPFSIKEAMAKIEELTGIKRSETQIRTFLKSMGMKLRKVGMIPSKADPDKQEAFKKKSWSLD